MSKITQEEFKERVKKYTGDSVEVISPYINKRTHVLIKCKTCGYEWEISPSSLTPCTTSKHSFIGCKECKYTECICDECGKTFQRLKSAVNKTDLHFCSKECGNRYKNK